MNWFYLYTSFDGRIGRLPFWMGFIGLLGVELLFHFQAYRIEGDRLSAIVDLAFTYPWFALFAKRAHDRNFPIFVVGAFFALAFGMDFLVIVFGGEPHALMLLLLALYLVLGLVLLVELGFRAGTPGANPFGPDPSARI